MKVLVTGSKGYCGIGIVHSLIEHGHQVIGFDRSYPDWYQETDTYRIELSNLTDYTSFFNAMQGCDAVIHSAIYTGSLEKEEFPQPFFPELKIDYTNTQAFLGTDMGTIYLFEAARQLGVKKICIVSSGAVVYYHIVDRQNETKYYPVKTTAKTTAAWRGFYGLTKHIQEEIGRFYAEFYNMSVSCMRAWWVVDGLTFTNKLGESLYIDNHVLTPSGLADRYDLGDACRLAVENPDIDFEIFYPVTGPGSDTYFDVQYLKDRLGWQPKYDFNQLKDKIYKHENETVYDEK